MNSALNQHSTISGKIRQINIITFSITLLFLLAFLTVQKYFETTQTVSETMKSRAVILEKALSASLVFFDKKSANELLMSLSMINETKYAVLFDTDEAVFAFYSRSALYDKRIQETRHDETHLDVNLQEYVFVQPVILDNERIGTLAIVYDFKIIYWSFLKTIAIFMFFISLALIFTIRYLSDIQKKIFMPLSALLITMEKVASEKDYSIRADVTSNDEFGVLAAEFNRMIESIRLANEELRDNRNNLLLTVQERTASLFEAKAAAEKANHFKTIFLANMSHEIRTPMNAILGFARILERDISLTPRQAEHVRTITRSGAYLLSLLNDILDMSKIEAGQTTLNPAVFCLHDFLEDIEMMFSQRAGTKRLQLIVERDENVPRYVISDESKLRQIVINLMGNAVKFTEKGWVAVRVHADKPGGKDAEVLRLTFEVEDSGPGIPDSDMDRLFQLFQQGEAGVKTGGTGLGLAISRRLVEMMGGTLIVTSMVGKGSCFCFDVLMEAADSIGEQEKPVLLSVMGRESGTGPFRILIVDDVPDNRTLLCELLRPAGFDVAEAGNGVEAIEVFERWSPHAVIMDMSMPVMDGYEATRHIRATESGRSIPVIAVTAGVFKDNEKQALSTGVDAYLHKPFDPEELLVLLGNKLGMQCVFADGAEKMLNSQRLLTISGDFTALPKDMILEMRLAVSEGDMTHLMELIGLVENINIDAARLLSTLADRYDYCRIDEWLEKEAKSIA